MHNDNMYNVPMYVRMYTHVDICTYACMYILTYVHMYILYVHMYVCT